MNASNKPKPERPNIVADQVDSAAGEEPVRHLKGWRIVVEALRLEDFPMSKTDVDYAVGDVEVEDGRGGIIPIRDLTDLVKKYEFSSAEDVTRTLHDALRTNKNKAA